MDKTTITGEERSKLLDKVDQLQRGERQPRDPADVLERLLAIVPEDKTSLRHGISSVLRWVTLAAPEIVHNAWHKLEVVLEEFLGAPTDAWQPGGWQYRVGRIVRAEE